MFSVAILGENWVYFWIPARGKICSPFRMTPSAIFKITVCLFLKHTVFLNLSRFVLFGAANDWTDKWIDETRERERERNHDSPLLPHFPFTLPEIFDVFKSKSVLPWDIFNHCGLKECLWWDERGATPQWDFFFFFCAPGPKRKNNRGIKINPYTVITSSQFSLSFKQDRKGWDPARVSALSVPPPVLLGLLSISLSLQCCPSLLPLLHNSDTKVKKTLPHLLASSDYCTRIYCHLFIHQVNEDFSLIKAVCTCFYLWRQDEPLLLKEQTVFFEILL